MPIIDKGLVKPTSYCPPGCIRCPRCNKLMREGQECNCEPEPKREVVESTFVKRKCETCGAEFECSRLDLYTHCKKHRRKDLGKVASYGSKYGTEEVPCANCGTMFSRAKHPTQRRTLCSKCRSKKQLADNKGLTLAEYCKIIEQGGFQKIRECAICGTRFKRTSNNQIYCSHTCKEKARSIRRKKERMNNGRH